MAGWCDAHATPRGEVLPLARVWELAQAWYGDRLRPDFRGRSPAQVQEIFHRLGLRSAFWDVPAAG